MDKSAKKMIAPLTGLRFFAAMMIVLFHLHTIMPYPRVRTLSQGVSFFFVLSGFVLCVSYYRQQNFNIKTFYLKRIYRLYPLHLFTLFLSVLLIKDQVFTQDAWPLILLSNITLTQAWIPTLGYVFSFNGVSWSIAAEMFFYALFPLLLVIFRNRLGLTFITSILGCLLFITLVCYFIVDQEPQYMTFFPRHLVLQFPVARLFEFIAGIGVGLFYMCKRPTIPRSFQSPIECLAIIIIIVFLLHWNAFVFNLPIPELAKIYFREVGMFPLWAGLILIFAISHGVVSKILSSRLFVLLGEASFALYMLHQLVQRIFVQSGVDFGPWANTLLLIAFDIILSVIIFKGFEKPVRNYLMIKTFKSNVSNNLSKQERSE